MSRGWHNYAGIVSSADWFKTEFIVGNLSNSYTDYMNGGTYRIMIQLYYRVYDNGWSSWYGIGWQDAYTGGYSTSKQITQMYNSYPGESSYDTTYENVGNWVAFKWDACNWTGYSNVSNDTVTRFEYKFEMYVYNVPALQYVWANENQSGYTGSGYFQNYFVPPPNLSVSSYTDTTITIYRSVVSPFDNVATFLYCSYDSSTWKYYDIVGINGQNMYFKDANNQNVYKYFWTTNDSGGYVTLNNLPQGSYQYIKSAIKHDTLWGRLASVATYTKYSQPTASSSSSDSSSVSITLNSVSGASGYAFDLYKAGVWQSYSSGSSASKTFSGLLASTQYEIRYYAYGSAYNSTTGSTYITTQALPTLGTPSFSSLTFNTKSISFTTSSVSNATSYDVTLKLNGNYVDSRTYSYAFSDTFDNLTHNTGYTITITVSASGYNSNNSTSNVTTDTLTVGSPTNVSVSQPSIYSYSVDLYYSWGSNASSMDFRWSTDQSNWNTYSSQSNNNYPSRNYYTDVGSIGNKYFQVRSRRTDGYNTVYSSWVNSSPYPINVVYNSRPSNFAWTTTIVQGGYIYQTDLPNKTLYVITSAEWNAFTSKINAFRVYDGLGNYSFTTASSGTTITKGIINEAITAINAISNRSINPPTARVTGDTINLASLYTQLRDSLNSAA